MNILGVHSLTHDTSVALAMDGAITHAVEEERLSRTKHQPGIEVEGGPPARALEWTLRASGIRLSDVDRIIHVGWKGSDAMRLDVSRTRFREFAGSLDPAGDKTRFVDHHLAHAASAYYASGFGDALILAIDGAGDWISTSLYVGEASHIEKVDEYFVDQSLGFMYSRAARLLSLGDFGFGEGKLLALAGYGEPIPQAPRFITLSDGRYRIDPSYYDWFKTFSCERAAWEQRHMDFAATVQQVLEETVLYVLENACRKYGKPSVCLAGGVALNCRLDGRLSALPGVQRLFVQPAANDAGLSIGAAYLGAADTESTVEPLESMFLGPTIDSSQVERVLARNGLLYEVLENPPARAAELITEGATVGWIQGALEFGPRALGHRSLLGDARSTAIRDRLNEIKARERWRPIAPSIIPTSKDYCDYRIASKYMTVAVPMTALAKRELPGGVHVDGSARIQLLDDERDPLWRLVFEVGNLTGVSAVLNTSLNRQGEPLCGTIEDGLEFFFTTPTEYLMIDRFLLRKR